MHKCGMMSQPLSHLERCFSAFADLICQKSREAVLQIHLSVHKPLDILILMIYHNHITRGLLAMQHYTTYFEVPFIHKRNTRYFESLFNDFEII